MILDRNAEIERTIFIGNPIAIMNRKVCDILVEEMGKVGENVNKEAIENYVKISIRRVKEELDRDLKMYIPFLTEQKEIEWVIVRHYHSFFLWTKGSSIVITPKEGDEEIRELFNTFPIEDTNNENDD